MSNDIGRAFAMLLAIALLVVTPIFFKSEIRSTNINSLAQAAIDQFTAEVEKEEAVTLASYEKMLERLSKIGLICDTQLQIGRYELRYAKGKTRSAVYSKPELVFCNAHVHTAACYREHNHAAEGCEYHTHSDACYCKGRLITRMGAGSERHTCSKCNGTGMRDGSSCPDCNGAGGWYPVELFYECSACGASSSSYREGVCGRMVCKLTANDYSCGIATNDTNPICDRVIADVQYENYRTVKRNDVLSAISTELSVKYLNGESGTVNAMAHGPEVFTECGETEIDLIYTGYFGTASDYSTKSFPLYIEVIEPAKTCDKCGRLYTPETDGTDSGCPYCFRGIVGIRVECAKYEYFQDEKLEADVFAIYDDGSEKPVPREETWDTFDTGLKGENTVFVGYLQYMQEVRVFVHGDETGLPMPTSEISQEDTSDDEGRSEDDRTEDDRTENDRTEDDNTDSEEAPVTKTPDDNYSKGRLNDSEGIDTVYDEFLGTEEIIELLENGGRIDLNCGDAFTVRITVKNARGYRGLFGNRDRTYTSGIIVK